MSPKMVFEKYGIHMSQQSLYCRLKDISLPSKTIAGRRVKFWPPEDLAQLLAAFGCKKEGSKK